VVARLNLQQRMRLPGRNPKNKRLQFHGLFTVTAQTFHKRLQTGEKQKSQETGISLCGG